MCSSDLVSDSDVQKMVEESVQHAFDDLKFRQWTEAKRTAGETLMATRKSMAEYSAELDPEYRGQLEAAMQNVEAVLATEDPKSKTGDPVRLKAVSKALDDVTKPLAEYAMDKVMEEYLRKRGALAP